MKNICRNNRCVWCCSLRFNSQWVCNYIAIHQLSVSEMPYGNIRFELTYGAFCYPSVSEVRGRCLATRMNTPLFLGRRTCLLGWTRKRLSKDSETEFKMAAPSVTCKYELFSSCLDHFGGLNGNFNPSYYCNTLMRPYICLWPILIFKLYLFCQCYRDNSFLGGVHVFLQRPTRETKKKRLKCGRDVTSRSESVRREY